MNRIAYFFNRIISFGCKHEFSTKENGMIRLTNIISLFSFTILLLTTIIAFVFNEVNSIIYDSVTVIIIVAPLILNYLKKTELAKFVLIMILIVPIIMGTFLFGYNTYFKFAVIIPIALSFMFFSKNQKWKLITPIITIIIYILFFEVKNYLNISTLSETQRIDTYYNTILYVFLVLCYIIMQSYFSSNLLKVENELVLYKKVFNNSLDGIEIVDTKGKFIEQNSSNRKIIGFSDEELEGKTPATHMGKEAFNEVENILNKTGKYQNEIVCKTKFGKKNIDLLVFSLLNENKQPVCYVHIRRDISERKKDELLLKQRNDEYFALNEEYKAQNEQLLLLNDNLQISKERLKMVIDAANIGTFEIDLNNNNIIINSNFAYFLDIEIENDEFVNLNSVEFENRLHPHDVQKFKDKREDLIKNKIEFLNVESRIISKNEEYKWVLIFGKLIKPTYLDSKIAFVGIIIDIDQLKKTELKLLEVNATKDKFFSIISHDLRSPFSGLLGLSSKLLSNHNDYTPERRETLISGLSQGIQNTYNLLENILSWASTQTNIITFNPERLNAHNLLIEILENFKNQALEKDITIKTKLEPNLFIHADKNMIETVVRNLLSNAIKFSYKGDKIELVSEIKNKEIVISVKDSGVGIPNDILTKLFSIENTVSLKGTNNESGTGLGLILCKEFIVKNGGEISVESKPGKGSMFKIVLPLLEKS